ncbi:MAG: hypothetical protein HY758_08215 [Nitrospirae bacterium]|nr:hypothetical protein [Nitrospirota bacterium]
MVEKIHNIKNLKRNREKLRSSLTPAEAKLMVSFENTEGVLKEIRKNFIFSKPPLTPP